MENGIEKILLTTLPFKYLDTHELNVIKSYCHFLNFKDKEIIFEQGKKNDGMCIILKGQATVLAKVLGKDMINLGTLEEGNFFGEVSLIQKDTCAATVVASKEVRCLHLPTAYFDMLFLFFPFIRYKISKAVTEQICLRIKTNYSIVQTLLDNSNMIRIPLLGQFIKAFEEPSPITFEAARINKKDLINVKQLHLFKVDELEQLFNFGELLKIPSNYSIIKEKDTGIACYILIRGAVQLRIITNKKAVKLAVLSPNAIFTNMTLIDNSASLINYTSCERAIIFKFTEDNLIALQKNQPELWYKLFNGICESFVGLEKYTDKMIIRLNSEMYNR